MRLYYDPTTNKPLYAMHAHENSGYPEGTWIEVTEEEAKQLQGKTVSNGKLVISSLDPLKPDAISDINNAVGDIRLSMISVLPGQEMIYNAKEAEAVKYLELPREPASLAGFPMLAAEVGITAPSAYELAQLWVNMSILWRETAASLEKVRLGAVLAIENAQSEDEIQQIVNDLKTTLEAFS